MTFAGGFDGIFLIFYTTIPKGQSCWQGIN